MSKFLRAIVNIFMICAIIVVAAILIPPLCGINTTIVDSTTMNTNLPVGSITYSKDTYMSNLAEGDKILDETSDHTFRYEIVSADSSTGDFEVKDTRSGETSEIQIINSASKVFFTVPFIGYIVYAMHSIEGIIIIALVVLVMIILFVLSELWKKDSEEEFLEEYFEQEEKKRRALEASAEKEHEEYYEEESEVKYAEPEAEEYIAPEENEYADEGIGAVPFIIEEEPAPAEEIAEQEQSEDISEVYFEDISESAPEKIPAETAEEAAEDIPVVTFEDIPAEAPEEIPAETPEETPAEISEEIPEAIPEELPEERHAEKHEDIPEEKAKEVREKAAAAPVENVSGEKEESEPDREQDEISSGLEAVLEKYTRENAAAEKEAEAVPYAQEVEEEIIVGDDEPDVTVNTASLENILEEDAPETEAETAEEIVETPGQESEEQIEKADYDIESFLEKVEEEMREEAEERGSFVPVKRPGYEEIVDGAEKAGIEPEVERDSLSGVSILDLTDLL